MRSSSVVAASAALVAGANAWASNVTYTTEVLTAYTTYCPSSTQIVHGTKTYTVTEVSKIQKMATFDNRDWFSSDLSRNRPKSTVDH